MVEAFVDARRRGRATLAAGGGDKLISIWNAATGERKSTLARDATVYAITFSPTGDLLTTGGGDKQASLWSRHGRLLAEMDGGRLQIELGSESERPADGPESGRRKLLQLLRWCAYGREGKGGGVWQLEGEVLAQTGLRRIGEAYGRADA